MICHGIFFLSMHYTRTKKLHEKKIVAIQVVHPYIKHNLDHLKTTKIRRNIHMTNESKNLESGALTCSTTIKFFGMCQCKAQSNLLK